MTLLAGEPARMLALAAHLETLGADLHRAAPPPPGRVTGVDARVADAHSAATRSAAVAIGRLADRLLADADLLYLVTARYDRADDQAAAALGAGRSAQPTTSELYPQLRSCEAPGEGCRQADAPSRPSGLP
ncbi:hypothetical protein ACFQY4_10655 [Catellatospora bangladeshensis]|uniref:Uncharacterized protein n=1 Tax=Catellatospora bangladeshensis TaxID=310355 RepID=A0A8J3JCD7_9ACTN|nr:hypothetical protein [Catellatospora bangladeshensis]GIF81726.1 hypothetical protein Cba03nite_30750 [Catellatospora bangladeshensis]